MKRRKPAYSGSRAFCLCMRQFDRAIDSGRQKDFREATQLFNKLTKGATRVYTVER